MEKQRILHVNIDNAGGNGAFSLVYYLYSELCNEYIFDFFTMGNFIQSKEVDCIKEKGGRIFSADLRKNRLLGHIKLPSTFAKVLKEYKYEVVHIHSEVAYKVFLYARTAKKCGVKKIIIHAHSDSIDGKYTWIKYIAHKICKNAICRYGTDFIAISESPAKWLFNEKVVNDKEHFFFITNGIVVDSYRFSENVRIRMREELRLGNNELIIGHVGALKRVKNQEYILDMVDWLKQQDKKIKLILVGDGENRGMLEKKITELKIEDKVILLGARSDVNEIMQAFDVLVFPSLFEGVPMTLIEAQSVGMPILASDVINCKIKINDNVYFLSLEEGAQAWGLKVLSVNGNHIGIGGYKNVHQSKYNIKNGAAQLKEVYKM